MTTITDALDSDNEIRSRSGMSVLGKREHVDELPAQEASKIRRTEAVAAANITYPPGSPRSLDGRVEMKPPISAEMAKEWHSKLESHLQEVKSIDPKKPPTAFPHLAWESIKYGLKAENELSKKLSGHIAEVERMQEDIALLLKLNVALGSNDEKAELTDEAKRILEQLEARGIVLKGSGEANVGELKRLAGSHESKLRSEIQIQFVTKLQRYMQQIESIMQILQKIIQYDSKLKEKTNQLQK